MEEGRLAKKKQKAKRDGNVAQLARVSKELGDLYFETGRLQDALLEYNDQLMACEVLNEKLNCAIAHRMIGEVRASLGEYEEALTHQTLHLEGAREAGSLLEQQRALATIGRTHFCQAQALPEGSAERSEACAAAKKSYSKSLGLCNDLENTEIPLAEMMTMRARLLLNLGLVLEEQKELQRAIELIEKAAELFKKYKVFEDLHRTHIALGALHERQGHFGLALRHIDEAINSEDSSLKADGQLAKAELLLRLGYWTDARQILVKLYLSKNLSSTTSPQVQRLLRIVVTICRAEESLEVENDAEIRRKLYESLGDAAAAVRAYEKALDYYKQMLSCAEMENSREEISAALVSLVQTYRDVSRYEEALPYARRELCLCAESTEVCRSALNLADLLHLTRAPKSEIMEMYNLAAINARKCENKRLEASVLSDTVVYLEESREFEEAEEIREKLNVLGDYLVEEASSENESESANIGDDICLEDLSDVEAETSKKNDGSKVRDSKRTAIKRAAPAIKRNAKGETRLHVACIEGNIEEVTRLLEAHHPTDVRDHCGWTPLHEAANHGHVEIAQLLIKSGANVDDPGGPMCGGVTPLHDAASCGHFSMMSLLMKSGANLLGRTKDGDTILDCLEAWKIRSGDLSPAEQAEYDNLHSRLCAVLPRRTKKMTVSGRKNDSIDSTDEEDDDDDDDGPRDERISAGEDYRRTIENLKNRGRTTDASLGRLSSTMKKISSPLVDSQEIVDDWLEDDLDVTVKEKTLVEESFSTSSAKRKSSGSSKENDKVSKRPRTESTDNYHDTIVVNDDDSRESFNSDSSDIVFAPRKIARTGKKKTKQSSLLKSGFTRDSIASRTPSPIFNYNQENSSDFARTIEAPSETIKLQIRIGDKLVDSKLRFPEQRETSVDSLTKDIAEKFEDETGCRIKITLTTMGGEVLLRENTLRNVRPVDGIVRLIADVVENEVPSIVDRYGKICKSHQIQPRDAVLKCLKMCENTSTLRIKSGQLTDHETIPLLKSLEYQEKLQILDLSGASLYDNGKYLNDAMKRLTILQELHLQGCDVDDNCLSRIEALPGQLKIFDLSYNPLGTRCEKKLYELLAHLRHLQTLNLRFCQLTRFSSSDEWSSLVNLDLSWNHLEIDANFLRRQMLSLNISNTRDNGESCSMIREIFNGTKISLRTLETLELSCCDLTDEDVVEVLSGALNLSKFVVSGNARVTKISVEMLIARKPSLTHIDAAGCQKIIQIPGNNVYIDNPRVCTLRASMSFEMEKFWLRLWRDCANAVTLPHDVITFAPIVH